MSRRSLGRCGENKSQQRRVFFPPFFLEWCRRAHENGVEYTLDSNFKMSVVLRVIREGRSRPATLEIAATPAPPSPDYNLCVSPQQRVFKGISCSLVCTIH